MHIQICCCCPSEDGRKESAKPTENVYTIGQSHEPFHPIIKDQPITTQPDSTSLREFPKEVGSGEENVISEVTNPKPAPRDKQTNSTQPGSSINEAAILSTENQQNAQEIQDTQTGFQAPNDEENGQEISTDLVPPGLDSSIRDYVTEALKQSLMRLQATVPTPSDETFILPPNVNVIYNGKKVEVVDGKLIVDGGDEVNKDEVIHGLNQGIWGLQAGFHGLQAGLGVLESTLNNNVELVKSDGSNYTYTLMNNNTNGRHVTINTNRSDVVGSNSRALQQQQRENTPHNAKIGAILSEIHSRIPKTESRPAETDSEISQLWREFNDLVTHERFLRENSSQDDIVETNLKSSNDEEISEYVRATRLEERKLEPTKQIAKELIYQDPKEYEILDTFEESQPCRDDRYIISLDECSRFDNFFYFHIAKPKRRVRKSLTPRELLKIESMNRYILAELQCLKAHNKFRAWHGVPPLVINEHLNKVARDWAEHLALTDAFYHRPNNEFGENLYYGPRSRTHAMSAVKAWYDEIKLYDYKNPGFSKQTGHFTQLIWKDTRELGTGVAIIGDKTFIVCNYHPPGNVQGKFNEIYVPPSCQISLD